MRQRITAVLVAHDGAAGLRATLDGLRAQSRPVDALIGVDVGSNDETRELLASATDDVVDIARTGGFASAVAAGIGRADDLRALDDGDANAADEWVWLIHDDSAPDYSALEALTTELDISPSATIAGCKQLDFDDPQLLRDVGLTTTRLSRRMTRLSRIEYDQGQHDSRRDTLAVNSAGMLIRRDVWDTLGGFDDAFGLYCDDIDFCRRARLNGNRVIVVPAAVMYHAEATTTGRRTAAALPYGPALALRRNEIYLTLVHAVAIAVPFLVIGVLLAAIGRALFKIAANDPADARREISAAVRGVSHPVRLARSRRRAARTRTSPRSVLTGLFATRRDVWKAIRDDWSGTAVQNDGSDTRLSSTAGDEADPADTQEAVEEFSPLDTLGPPRRRVWSHPALLVIVGLVIVSVAASYRLIGPGNLLGGAIEPAPDTFSGLFDAARSTWTAAEAGWPGVADPFQAVLTAFALLLAGQTSILLPVLLIAAVPLAGLGAWVAAGSVTDSRPVRAWTALAWASLPALTMAITGGRIGAVVAHILLPWVALGIVRATGSARARRSNGRPGKEGIPSYAAAAGGGLALAAAAAGAPSLAPALVLVVIAAACLAPNGRRRALVWLILPVLALFGPFIVELVKKPRLLAADPGAALAFTPAPPWQQVLMQPVTPDKWPYLHAFGSDVLATIGEVAPIFTFAPVILVAIAALLITGGNARGVRLSWFVAALGLATAVAGSHIAVGVGTEDRIATGWPGAGVSLLAAGFLAAGVAGSRRVLAHRAHAGLKATIAVVTVLATLGPVLNLSAWTTRSVAGTTHDPHVERDADLRLPAVATDRGVGSDRTRTLLLTRPHKELTGTLIRGSGIDSTRSATTRQITAVDGLPGQETVTRPDAAQTATARAVAAVAAGAGGDPRNVLAPLDVGFIVLADEPVDKHGEKKHRPDEALTGEALQREQEFKAAHDRLAAAIDTDAGLTKIGQTDAGELWRVEAKGSGGSPKADRPARVHIVGPGGTAQAVVPSDVRDVDTSIADGKAGRRIVLSERFDPNWTATLDGHELTGEKAGWRQAFELPASGGDLKIVHRIPWQWAWRTGQGIVLLLAILIAIPLPGRRRETRRVRLENTGRTGSENETEPGEDAP